MTIIYTEEARKIIDRRRRDLINGPLKNAKGEVSEMYYEGARVTYQECQDLLEAWANLEAGK